jgi:hypothetical protein
MNYRHLRRHPELTFFPEGVGACHIHMIQTQKKLDDWGVINNPFDWTKYNHSQTKEKTIFLQLLGELCNLTEGDRKSVV